MKPFMTPVARGVPFDNTGTSHRQLDVQNVLQEMQGQKVWDPDLVTTSLNGTLNLTTTSKSLQLISGTATGFSMVMPDATSLFKGSKYEIVNTSSQQMTVKDGSSATLVILNSGDSAELTLKDNVTIAGVWLFSTDSTVAVGIANENVTSSTPFVAASATDVIITGFTVTPKSGTYAVFYSADITIEQNNRLATCTIYRAGVAVTETLRTQQGVASNFFESQNTMGIISVNGAQALDVRVSINVGNLTVRGRTLLAIRLGQ